MAETGRVLVLDAEVSHTLDVIRCLGRRGLAVVAASERAGAGAFRSRFVRERFVHPAVEGDGGAFLGALDAYLQRHPVDLVVPVTDVTVVPLARNLAAFEGVARIATESEHRIETFRDKRRTMDLARTCNVPVPRTWYLDDPSALPVLDAVEAFPVVCKPVYSKVWHDGAPRHLSVFYAFDAAELRRRLASDLALCPFLVQEYVHGDGVGVEVLADRGELLQVFQHRRLHELPITGGGSTYRESVPVDERLREHTARLLGAAGWSGVAMVEFKQPAGGGEPLLMEVNGRFWGSLPLSSRAGMDFPGDLYDLQVRGRRNPQRRYRHGVRCRKLREDVLWLKESLKVRPGSAFVDAGIVQYRRPVALLREFSGVAWRDRFDVQVWWDPWPGLVDLTGTVTANATTVLAHAARRARRNVVGWWRLASGRRRLQRRLGGARSILLVCYGNIMRSAFAAPYLANRLAEHGRADVVVTGAGTGDRAGRPAHPDALAEARRWSVDLSSHRSVTVSRDLVAGADVVLAMDAQNLEDLRERYPWARDRIYLLGVCREDWNPAVEVADPYGQGRAACATALAAVAAHLDRVAALAGGGRAQAADGR